LAVLMGWIRGYHFLQIVQRFGNNYGAKTNSMVV
jgi:hypothetical protein